MMMMMVAVMLMSNLSMEMARVVRMLRPSDDDDDGGSDVDVQPLYGDGQGGEDAAGHAGVGERVDQVGEEDCEHAAVRLCNENLNVSAL